MAKPKPKADPAKKLNMWGSGSSQDALEADLRYRMFQPVYIPGTRSEPGLTAPFRLRPLSKEDYQKRQPVPKREEKSTKKTHYGTGATDPYTIDEEKVEPTSHEKTQALKDRKAAIDTAKEVIKESAKTGKVSSQVEGVNKKEKKNFFERNIGSKFADAAGAIGRSVVGDVAGRGLDIISRPNQAALGAVTWGLEKNLLNMDPLSSTATKNPANIPREKWNKMTDKQKKVAEDNYKAAQEVVKHTPWHRAAAGLTGKEKNYSVIPNQFRQIQQQTGYNELTPAQRVLGTASGLGADVVVDPTNLIGAGVVSKGVKAVKKARTAEEVVSDVRKTTLATKVAMDTEEAVQKTKISDQILARLAEDTPTWKAPLELGPGPKPATAFEFGGAAQAEKRAAELADETLKAEKIKDATEAGFKSLKKETTAQARKIVTAKKLAGAGKITSQELLAETAKHENLLKRVTEAEKVRGVAETLPVGGKLALHEKRVERLSRLAEKVPNNPVAARKLETAAEELRAARLANIPENADKILSATNKLKAGKNISAAEIKAVVEAEPSVQDKLIALAKEAERKDPSKKVIAATKAGQTTSAELPSNRLMAKIDEATQKITATAATQSTLSEAAQTVLDGTASARHQQIALDMLNDANVLGRPLTKAGIRSKVAQHALKLIADEGVQEAALASTGEKIATLKSTGEKLIPSAHKEALFNDSLLEEVLPVTDAMTKILEDGIGKRFAVRFAGKDLGEFAPIGAALRGMYVPFELTGRLGQTGAGRTFAKAFRMGAHFPDETNYMRQVAEQYGINKHLEWVKDVTDNITNKVTPEQARLIARAIETDSVMPVPELEAIRQYAIAQSDKIFSTSAEIGKYTPGQKVKGYVYHYYHSRNKAATKAFKDARTAELREGLSYSTIEVAKKAGLKPEDRIDRILIMQHRDLVRDVQRANFRQQVIAHFGVKTDNPAFANGLGLQEVSGNLMNKPFQDVALAEKTKWYLPPEIHDTFKAMDGLMTMGYNKDADGVLGLYDSLVRGFKTSATIANPANWVNNTAGDIFLNYVDGVKSPTWYYKAGKMLHLGQEAPRTVSIAGHSVESGKVLSTFMEKAPAGGFIRTESGHMARLGGRKGPLGVPAKTTRAVQGAYEAREETVRLAHYLHAIDDETRRLMGKGMSFEKAYEHGSELAAKRVAKWNIDYTAITPFERAVRKRFVPFYTFMRKATPLMLEGMVARPGKMVHYDRARRAIEQMMGVPPMEDDGTVWPEWAKQQGITRLQSAEQADEPYYFRDPSPFNVINRILGGESNRAPILNMINQTAPPIKSTFELAQGRSLYNDRPIDSWGDWMLNQFPTVSIGARALGHPLSPQKTSKKSGAGTSIAERLSTIGLPVGKMTEERQQAALHGQIGAKGEGDIYKRVRDSLEPYGYKISTSHPKGKEKFYIVRAPDGSIFGRYRDFTKAFLEVQNSLPSGG